MQTKCDASLEFSFLMLMLLDEDAKCNFLFMMQMSHTGMKNAKFIHDDTSARIQTMMQMSPYKDGDANVF